jgi:integrase
MLKPLKMANPRTLSITNMHGILTKDVFGRLNLLPKVADRVFGNNKYYSIRNDFKSLTKRIAHKLNNPDIARITPHILRHYVGTNLQYATKDMMTVKYLLGHVNIQSTVRYVHLAKAYFTEPTNFITKIANTDDEQIELMNQGFELCGLSVSKKPILRKPK